jgi:putative spermidine/putrescine transport system substrate-binding protein
MEMPLKLPLAAAILAASFAVVTPGSAQVPAMPSSPVTLNVIDVAGNLALTRPAIEKYQKEHPNAVSKVTFTTATAPELPAKLKAQQAAGRVDIDMVLTGTDALAAGVEQKLYMNLLPNFAAKFPGLEANYLPGAAAMLKLSENQGIVVTYYPSGPLIEYAPERVKDPPKTTDELLAWCKAHPNRLMYARPANSGPGRTFLMGLPYLLGDSNPKDPVNGWSKTWAYLKQLGDCIEYYPSGTGVTMKQLGEGSLDMIVTTTGWDINPRVLGTVPKSAAVTSLKGFHWVTDAHYMVIPNGVAPEKIGVLLDLMAYMLKPEQQAFAYDKGYFYPGPAVKNVPLSMAPQESQQAIEEFGRPEYAQLIAGNPLEIPLDAKAQVAAFKMWDEQIGGSKVK